MQKLRQILLSLFVIFSVLCIGIDSFGSCGAPIPTGGPDSYRTCSGNCSCSPSIEDCNSCVPAAGSQQPTPAPRPPGATNGDCIRPQNNVCYEWRVPPTSPSSSTGTSSSSSSSSAGSSGGGGAGRCTVAATLANTECAGGMGVGQGVALVRQLRTEGTVATNELEMCRKRLAQARAARTGGYIVAAACTAAYTACMLMCRGNNDPGGDNRFMCTMAFQRAGGTTLQTAMQTTSDISELESQCQRLEAMNCETGSQAADNPQCIEKFCAKHGNEPVHNAICYRCNRAGGNDLKECPQYCMYHSEDKAKCNPDITPPNIPGASMPSLAGGDIKSPSLPLPPDGIMPPDFNEDDITDGDYAGQQNLGSSGKFDANDSAGGGGGLAGGAYPGGAGAAQGQGKDQGQFDKNIDHGVNSGGGYSVGGGGVDSGGGGGGPGGGGNANPLDLSKFLPGGELDPSKRGPASEELAAQGITGANDLSNFEKITRMMNKKKPVLKSGEGS